MNEVYLCTTCGWSGPESGVESHTVMPARRDPPDPGEYLDKCPACQGIDTMQELDEDEICIACYRAARDREDIYCHDCRVNSAEHDAEGER